MNLAWGGIVLLVLLLPGFLFFVGLYFPERFTRQLAERSPLGQLAGSVLVSFAVHGLLFAMAPTLCTTNCIRLDHLLTLMSVVQPTAESLAEITNWIGINRWRILGYVIASAGSGLIGGIITGHLIVYGPLRFLAQHTWVYNLLLQDPDGVRRVVIELHKRMPFLGQLERIKKIVETRELTAVYVLTTTRHEERILLYRGYLKAFGIKTDGTFTYLVLVQAIRMYLELPAGQPATTPKEDWHAITTFGTSAGTAYLYLDGSQIANAMFDRESVPMLATQETGEFEAIVAKVKEELEKVIFK